MHRILRMLGEVSLRQFGSAFAVVVLLLVALGCGSGSSSRQLQSMNISPATANGQVQFVATGHYNKAPLTTITAQYLGDAASGKSTSSVLNQEVQ